MFLVNDNHETDSELDRHYVAVVAQIECDICGTKHTVESQTVRLMRGLSSWCPRTLAGEEAQVKSFFGVDTVTSMPYKWS